MKYKAVFLDVDGTLLKNDHSVSPATVQTLRRIQNELDIPVVLATARPPRGASHIYQEIGLKTPLITLNGAVIMQYESHNANWVIRDSTHISAELSTHLYPMINRPGMTIHLYHLLEWYTRQTNPSVEREQRAVKFAPIFEAPEVKLQQWRQAETGPNKISISGPSDEILEMEAQLLARNWAEVDINRSQSHYLEIVHSNTGKAKAMQKMLALLGIPANETIAIGDNFNDREMIRQAGWGIAMGNAPDAVKETADQITDTNEADGVRKALESLLFD